MMLIPISLLVVSIAVGGVPAAPNPQNYQIIDSKVHTLSSFQPQYVTSLVSPVQTVQQVVEAAPVPMSTTVVQVPDGQGVPISRVAMRPIHQPLYHPSPLVTTNPYGFVRSSYGGLGNYQPLMASYAHYNVLPSTYSGLSYYPENISYQSGVVPDSGKVTQTVG